jgi:uncharacterized protein (DUF885 family)
MYETNFIRSRVFLVIISALCGGIAAGFCVYQIGHRQYRELDARYNEHARNAATTVTELESNLERERELDRQARAIVEDLSGGAKRNIRNLQEAIGLLKELRTKIELLEDFYDNRDTGGGSP